jgi:hypothetical protein
MASHPRLKAELERRLPGPVALGFCLCFLIQPFLQSSAQAGSVKIEKASGYWGATYSTVTVDCGAGWHITRCGYATDYGGQAAAESIAVEAYNGVPGNGVVCTFAAQGQRTFTTPGLPYTGAVIARCARN